jgi:hypothetical protein
VECTDVDAAAQLRTEALTERATKAKKDSFESEREYNTTKAKCDELRATHQENQDQLLKLVNSSMRTLFCFFLNLTSV